MSLELHTIPVISTGHITREVADRLDREDNPWCSHATYRDVGFFLFLDEPYAPEGDPVPKCLLDIRDWLRSQEKAGVVDNCRWVRLDCDADPVDSLPFYDW